MKFQMIGTIVLCGLNAEYAQSRGHRPRHVIFSIYLSLSSKVTLQITYEC